MVVGLCVFVLLTLKLVIDDHDSLFLMAEAVHFLGIGVLGYKLVLTKNCSGLSLRSQDLTAIFLGIRLYCSAMMEGDWHTLLDALTLAATLWICYAMRFTDLKRSYAKGLDTLPVSWVLGPCAVAALAAHPTTSHMFVNRFLWATCVYVEAVSVLPQLRMMQRAKVVERFTANYVFARSASRASSPARTGCCRSSTGSRTLPPPSGSGLWPVMVLLSEVVQTFILADFCYYYVLSTAEGGRSSGCPRTSSENNDAKRSGVVKYARERRRSARWRAAFDEAGSRTIPYDTVLVIQTRHSSTY